MFKLVLLLFVPLLVYNVYFYIIRPFLARRKFSGYKNVYVTPNPKFMVGDAAKYREGKICSNFIKHNI